MIFLIDTGGRADADEGNDDDADFDDGAEDNEDDVDLAIGLDQLASSMPVAGNIGALLVNIIISVIIILHCHHTLTGWTHSEDVSIMVGELALPLLHPLLPLTSVPGIQEVGVRNFQGHQIW